MTRREGWLSRSPAVSTSSSMCAPPGRTGWEVFTAYTLR